MSFFFAQIQLLAMPLRMLPESSGFGESYDPEKLIEQLVVYMPPDSPAPDWDKIDSRIVSAETVCEGLHILTVPTFKTLTDVLVNLSHALPTGRVIEISNQRHIQVRVSARDPQTQIPILAKTPGCEVMFDYRFPTDGSQAPPSTKVSLCVTV